MNDLKIPAGRDFDLACLGRLAVDLYAQQVGSRLEDVSSFAKYLGGSSATSRWAASCWRACSAKAATSRR